MTFAEELPEYVPGEIIVKFTKDTIKSPLEANVFLQGKSSYSPKEIKPLIKKINEKDDLAEMIGLNRTYFIRFDPDIDLITLISDLKIYSEIEYVEPNYIFHEAIPLMPNDNYFINNYHWNFHNTGIEPTGFPGRPDADIDAPEAWGIWLGDSSAKIGIVDSGIDLDHPDLIDGLEQGYDFVDIVLEDWLALGYTLEEGEDYTVEDLEPEDFHGHGTKCAGVAVAKTNNVIGVASVCPNCKLIPLRVAFRMRLNNIPLGLYDSVATINAIYYAANNDVNILSMSFTGTCTSSQDDALSYAYQHGIILIGSAGNSNMDMNTYPNSFCPASNPNVIAVAATTNTDERWSYDATTGSNYGSRIDVAAPGNRVPTTKLGGSYSPSNSGTSMSSPHVAGMAGLILSKYSDSDLTIEQIYGLIKNSVDFWGENGMPTPDYLLGTGRINAHKAVTWDCNDGTYVNQCSNTKPKYCQLNPDFGLQLTNNCQVCGCPPNSYCSGNSCIYDGSSPIFRKTGPITRQSIEEV